MRNFKQILKENERRKQNNNAPYNPVTGLNASGDRVKVEIEESPLNPMYLPKAMANLTFVKRLARYGLSGYLTRFVKDVEITDESLDTLWKEFCKLRSRHDFEFWAFSYIEIKSKTEPRDVPFLLNRAQRKVLGILEGMRLKGKPIKFILLKARQWGGSTLIQIYMLWIMLTQRRNWNSVICGDVEAQSRNVRSMLTRAIRNYPAYLLDSPILFTPFEGSSKNKIIQNTNCVVSIGSFQKPDTLRSGDISGAHLTEIGLWQATPGKKPEDLIQSISGSIYDMEYSFLGLESTAKGVGNFLHREWRKAVKGKSNLTPIFVAWFEIDIYSSDIGNYEVFLESMSEEEWRLWDLGATLEAIAWYRTKCSDMSDMWRMNSEYPSTPEEAFQSTGRRVFRIEDTIKLRKTCIEPMFIGEISGLAETGPESVMSLTLEKKPKGDLSIWKMPDKTRRYRNRYIVVMDIGGVSDTSDYTDITVFDRYWMMEAGVPEVVAEWHGHIDHDKGAWKAVQMASFYADDENAMVVIESNTLETEGTEGDNFEYILDEISGHYSNLYCRTPADQIREGAPAKWGFHTNTSTKKVVINFQVKAIRDSLYIERCEEAVDEHDTYEIKENGKTLGAVEGMHDDRLMVRAIGVYVCYSLPLPFALEKNPSLTRRTIVSEATI